MSKKVFVSGCFDLLHAGHVEFLQTAVKYGSELYVSVGSDNNVYSLKGVKPTYSEKERVFILNALECVTEAFVSSGMGIMDFVDDFERIKPDVFVVNHDGASEDKAKLCKDFNTEYVVLDRIPAEGLPKRSSTDLRGKI
ncbi:MAG: adenylyltransferase/cytidyltransferase family protein [Nanobdellota archaeon]